jgi:hypothetical protein
MKLGEAGTLLKKFSTPIMVLGGALAAFGLTSYGGNRIYMGWSDSARIEIAIGVGLFLLGMFSRKNTS